MEWDEEIDRCPKSYLTYEVMEVIAWYLDFKRFGALPYHGDALDQPLYIYEGLCLCVDAYANADLDRGRLNAPETDGMR